MGKVSSGTTTVFTFCMEILSEKNFFISLGRKKNAENKSTVLRKLSNVLNSFINKNNVVLELDGKELIAAERA